jgi:TldD protein
MIITRRTFLQSGSTAVGLHLLTPRLFRAGTKIVRAGEMTDYFPDATIMEQIAQQAVDAAMSAGATYADVRLTHLLSERYESQQGGADTHDELARANDLSVERKIDVGDFGGGGVGYYSGLSERPNGINGIPAVTIGIGVRALVRGYWGFASCASWTDADAVRLGGDAAAQATVNARAGKPRSTELGTIPIVRKGRWVQPGIDPFLVPVDEKLDVLRALTVLPSQGHRFVQATVGSVGFQREERAFASSEGASYSQIRYQCFIGDFVVNLGSDPERGGRGESWSSSQHLEDARYARGWEVIRELDMDQLGETLLSQVIAERQKLEGDRPAVKPTDIGKYDVVFDTGPTASLVYQTLGVATELDRAMGYEANARGTSYLGPDPFQYLGTQVVSSHVTLTADRTTPHANATAQWDDEGVRCRSFPLIQKGVLVDYQTTREQAHWIADWYTRKGMPIQSNGCAIAETALDYPMQMSPNFTLEPGPEEIDVDDLIKDTKRGVYFPSGVLQVDQQVKNGVFMPVPGAPPPREIRNGKLGPILNDPGVLFNSQELWKNVLALGGANSAAYNAAGESKGEPSQWSQCNVRTVPMKVKDCAIIDVKRKA